MFYKTHQIRSLNYSECVIIFSVVLSFLFQTAVLGMQHNLITIIGGQINRLTDYITPFSQTG